MALGQAHGTDVEAHPLVAPISSVEPPPMSTTSVALVGLADAAQRELGLFVSGEEARREPVAPLDLAEERLAVLRVADGARRDEQRALGAEGLQLAAVLGSGSSARARSAAAGVAGARRRLRRAG